MAEIVHNVTNRRYDYIGSWEVAPLDYDALQETDAGRRVVYRDFGRAELGYISSWRNGTVFALFHKGDTAAGCNAEDLVFATKQIGPNEVLRR